MSNTLSKVFIFTVGAAIGSLVTWKLLRTKYERIAQEEIESVKETFAAMAEKKEENSEEETTDEPELAEDDSDEYREACASVANSLGYIQYSVAKKGLDDAKKPYVISPDEYDENGYDTETLYYYSDKILADDQDNIIEDVDSIVGYDSLTHFGEYEDDSVFVRNDKLEVDYEILLSDRRYSDAAKVKPHQAEGE